MSSRRGFRLPLALLLGCRPSAAPTEEPDPAPVVSARPEAEPTPGEPDELAPSPPIPDRFVVDASYEVDEGWSAHLRIERTGCFELEQSVGQPDGSDQHLQCKGCIEPPASLWAALDEAELVAKKVGFVDPLTAERGTGAQIGHYAVYLAEGRGPKYPGSAAVARQLVDLAAPVILAAEQAATCNP